MVVSRIEHMFEGMDDLDPAGALAAAVARRRAADLAEAELLALAAHWADPTERGPDRTRPVPADPVPAATA